MTKAIIYRQKLKRDKTHFILRNIFFISLKFDIINNKYFHQGNNNQVEDVHALNLDRLLLDLHIKCLHVMLQIS